MKAKLIKLFESKKKKRLRRMDELNFGEFDKATCKALDVDPDAYKRMQDKFIRYVESLG